MFSDIPKHDGSERAAFLIVLGALGLSGCVILIAGAIIAPFFVPGHDWIADTISDLAAGRYEIIMDVALYGFAAGLFGIALAASHAHLGALRWSIGVLSLTLLAVLVTIIGARNEYGDGDNEGVVIHIYLVYGLGIFFLVAPLCLAPELHRNHPTAAKVLMGSGVLWGMLSPVFFFLPTSMDGIYERFLGLIACVTVATLGLVFVERGRAALRTDHS